MPPQPFSAVCASQPTAKPLDGCHGGTGCPTGSRTMHDHYRASAMAMAQPCSCPLPVPHLLDHRAPTIASRPRSPSLDTITALRAHLAISSRSSMLWPKLRL